jgi:hypothetical protein
MCSKCGIFHILKLKVIERAEDKLNRELESWIPVKCLIETWETSLMEINMSRWWFWSPKGENI